jgi:mono/diheme cytochrome c family protein
MPNPTTGLRQQGQVLHDGVKILTASCSKCHDGTIAKTKGGGVVLTEGGVLVALTDSQMLAIVREIYSGRMPKGSKLTDADVGTVIEWVDTRK